MMLKLLRNSWHCSQRELISRIESGALINSNVNPEDVRMFFKIFKYDVKKFQGSAKRTKLAAPKLTIRRNPDKREVAIAGDLYEVCSQLFMNTTSMQGKYTCIEKLYAKDSANVVQSLLDIRHFYDTYGYAVKYIYFDSESSVIHYRQEIEAAGRKVVVATHGTKVGPAELNNRCVDERFSSQFASTPHPLNELIVEWMVVSTGHILNTSERKFEDGVVIPYQMIDPHPIDANYHYAFSPCDAHEHK